MAQDLPTKVEESRKEFDEIYEWNLGLYLPM